MIDNISVINLKLFICFDGRLLVVMVYYRVTILLFFEIISLKAS